MRVVTDKKFIPSRIRESRFLTWGGLALLVIGWISSFNSTWILFSLLALIIGFPLFNSGRYLATRWGMRPRPDEVLEDALKGLDQRYTLYNYIQGVPVEHFLVSPVGVYVIETRHQMGRFEVHGDPAKDRDRWSRVVKSPVARFLIWTRSFSEGALGNPSNDLRVKTAQMRKYLAENLPADILQASGQSETEEEVEETPIVSKRGGFSLPGLSLRRSQPDTADEKSPIPVEGVVVFVNPKSAVEIDNPVVPVVPPDELKTFIRNQVNQDKTQVQLNVATLRRLARLWETPDSEARIATGTKVRRPVGRLRSGRPVSGKTPSAKVPNKK